MDGNTVTVIDTLPEAFTAGEPSDADWCRYVLDNSRRASIAFDLEKGSHTIRFAHLDPGVVLQKIEIAQYPSDTFYGYRTTPRRP
jgi:hypothetical protein